MDNPTVNVAASDVAQAAPEPAQVNQDGGNQDVNQGQEQDVQANENNQTEGNEPSITDANDAFAQAVQKDIQKQQARSKDNLPDVSNEQSSDNNTNDNGDESEDQANENGNQQFQSEQNGETDDGDRNVSKVYGRQHLESEAQRISVHVDKAAHNSAVEAMNKDYDGLGNYVDEQGKGTLTIWQLSQNDPNTGQKIFMNPFDPENPATTMSEAREIVNNFNDYIENVYKQSFKTSVETERVKYLPYLKQLEFAPRFNKMDPKAQRMFWDELKPYQVKNSNGEVVGWDANIDLHQVANRIENFISRYTGLDNSQQQQPTAQSKPEPKPQTPPVDMKTANIPTENTQNKKKITNADEAFANAVAKDIKKRQGGK